MRPGGASSPHSSGLILVLRKCMHDVEENRQ